MTAKPIAGPYRVGPTGSNEFERFVIATAPDGSALYVAAVRTPMQSDGSKYDAEARDATAALLAASWSMREALSAAAGYFINVSIDLQTGTKKQLTVETVRLGLKIVQEALAMLPPRD